MEAFALYLFKSVVWLTGFVLVYLLFLRNERFFLLNRLYLVAGIVASILFPFFTWHYTIVIPFVPQVEVSDLQMTGVIAEPEAFPTNTILLYLYLAGALYLLYRIIRQTMTVMRVIRKSEILPYRSAKLIRTAEYPASFSFFSFVFVNPSSTDIETNEIVNHELEHVSQQHWIDLLLFELLCILQWLNPLCWLYGRFIRQNHEYLADQRALQRTANPAIYRAALINQLVGGQVITLANSFNYSINKKRFHMMKNTINQPIRKLKLLLILPIIAGVFYAFATPEYKYAQADVITTQQTEKTITGKVMDEKGNPLKGAIFSITGKTIGTATDENGAFKLIVTDNSPLIISHLGYQVQKMDPTFDKEMLITLKPVVIEMDEVSVTAAASNVGQDAHLPTAIKLQSNSPLKFGYIDGQSEPIIVLDGVITKNANVNNIPPETIESINVLKGESAIKLYGEKGKNGVIQITKKKGSSDPGKSLISLNIDEKDIAKKKDDVYTIVEQMPEFPGGDKGLGYFIASHIKYPKVAIESSLEGKVFVTFVVTSKGSVVDAKILRGADPSLDQEALRVVNSMPLWTPGKQNGKEVDVQYTLPINFVLEKEKTAAKEEQDDAPYTVVEQMPEFPGGDEALRKFIGENVKYPKEAAENGIEGKVFVTFVVSKAGNVANARIARSADPSLDKEAIRVVESMPTWIPGKQNGENVTTEYTIPINFVLEHKEKTKTDLAAQKGKLIIVPNPAEKQATVTLEGSDATANLEVSVFDNYGKLMLKETKNGPRFTLSVSSLAPGSYVVVANDGSKQYQGSLLVKH